MSSVLVISCQFAACRSFVGIQAQEPARMKVAADSVASVEEYFSTLALQEMFNGNVLLALDHKVVLRKSFNARSAPDGMKVSVEDPGIIASVAKLYIKYAILKLVEQERLTLDAPLSKFAPDIPGGNKITIAHLINHTSGLPRELTGIEDMKDVSSQRLVELASREVLRFEPGAETHYSNVGYQLLVFVINQVAPGGYETYMMENVYEPLGMSCNELTARRPDNLISGFERVDKEWRLADSSELEQFKYLRIFSSVDDLFRFAEGVRNRNLTSAAISEQMMNGDEFLRHSGALGAYRTLLISNPETGFTFVMLANTSEMPFQQIAKDIPDIVAGKLVDVPGRPDRKSIEVEIETLKKYEGHYSLNVDSNQAFDVRLDDDHLVMIDNDGEVTQLFAETATRFFAEPDSDDSVEFMLNVTSEIFEMVLIIEGGVRLETTRVVGKHE